MRALPPHAELVRAWRERDPASDGIFYPGYGGGLWHRRFLLDLERAGPSDREASRVVREAPEREQPAE